MKRLVSTLILFLALVLPTKAATTSISFMGVSMDYDIEKFCNKLVDTYGFTITEQNGNQCQLQGTYMGIKKCTISIGSHSYGGKVAMVVVTFPKKNSWKELLEQYNDVLRRFRINAKYRFVEQVAEFDSPYYDGCGNEMEGVRQDKCNYHTILATGENLLMLGIDTDQTVNVYYVDANTVSALISAQSGSSSQAPTAQSSSSSSSSSSATPSSSSSSSSSEVLTFLNIPMRGTYREFAQRLIDERGFTFHNETPSVPSISLRGVIDGLDNSEVYIFGDSETNALTYLDVYLPEHYSWSDILSEYNSYVEYYSSNYTLLDQSSSFNTNCNGNEVEAVRSGDCEYYSIFALPGGHVIVKISTYMQTEISYIRN